MRYAATLIAGALMTAGALAQDYPQRPIRLLVGFTPGGSTDVIARVIAHKLSETMGVQVLIDNRPGAGGNIGVELTAKSPPDGYTLVMGHIGTMAVNPTLYNKIPYAPSDFVGVCELASSPNTFTVKAELPAKTIKELITQAKGSNGKFNIGSINIGTTQHLSAELLKSMAGLDAAAVPFNNTAGVLTALRGNSIQVAMEFLPPVLGQIRANTLRAVAVTSIQRSPMLPNVPTLNESGLNGFEVNSWNGIAVPAKTPKAIVDKLNKALADALAKDSVRKQIVDIGAQPRSSTSEELTRHVAAEIAKWQGVREKAGIPQQ